MAVAFDAQSNGAVFTTVSPHTFTHTPVGVPRGVAVKISAIVSTDSFSAVTYGGVPLTLQLDKESGGAENGRAQIWVAGADLPTGPQTVSIVHNGGAFNKRASCVTVTANEDVEVGDSDFVTGDIEDASVDLTTVKVSLRVCCLYSGYGDVGSLAERPGQTVVTNHSNGFRTCMHSRQTTPGSGTFTIGYTSTGTADSALVAVALQESDPVIPPDPPAGPAGGNRMGGTGAIRRPPRTFLHR